MKKIPPDKLIEIFNSILDSYVFVVNVPSLDFIQDKNSKSYRNNKIVKDYYDEKLFDIEQKLIVFENIPDTNIYKVLEEFINIIESYNKSKQIKKRNSKKLQNDSYKLRQKDIKIIEKYQEILFNYTSYHDWNMDLEYSILVPELDEIYEKNLLLLEELRTKNFKILDPIKYGGTNLYDSTKKKLKVFFMELQKKYLLKSLNIKEMIDIL